MKVAIYVRVSRIDLHPENQLRELEQFANAMCWDYEIFEEKESTRKTRDIKQRMLEPRRERAIQQDKPPLPLERQPKNETERRFFEKIRTAQAERKQSRAKETKPVPLSVFSLGRFTSRKAIEIQERQRAKAIERGESTLRFDVLKKIINVGSTARDLNKGIPRGSGTTLRKAQISAQATDELLGTFIVSNFFGPAIQTGTKQVTKTKVKAKGGKEKTPTTQKARKVLSRLSREEFDELIKKGKASGQSPQNIKRLEALRLEGLTGKRILLEGGKVDPLAFNDAVAEVQGIGRFAPKGRIPITSLTKSGRIPVEVFKSSSSPRFIVDTTGVRFVDLKNIGSIITGIKGLDSSSKDRTLATPKFNRIQRTIQNTGTTTDIQTVTPLVTQTPEITQTLRTSTPNIPLTSPTLTPPSTPRIDLPPPPVIPIPLFDFAGDIGRRKKKRRRSRTRGGIFISPDLTSRALGLRKTVKRKDIFKFANDPSRIFLGKIPRIK